MRIINLAQTCYACPSQWEGSLEDGRTIYIRYRHGRLSVSISHEPTDSFSDAVTGENIYSKTIGDDLDGFIEWEKVSELTGLIYSPKEEHHVQESR